MAFLVPVILELAPPAPFLGIADAKEKLVSYGWPKVVVDAGPIGAISSAQQRKVTFTIEGKTGATKEIAEKDVQDAVSGVGNGVRFIRGVWAGTKEAFKDVAHFEGEALGGGISGFGKGVGLGGGPGALLAGGLFTILLVGVGIAVLVVALRKT